MIKATHRLEASAYGDLAALMRKGIKRIEQGGSAVFPHPTMSHIEIKVSHLTNAYRWFKWCFEHPNVFVTQVYALKYYDQYYIVLREALKPAKESDIQKFMARYRLEKIIPMRAENEWYLASGDPELVAKILNPALKSTLTYLETLVAKGVATNISVQSFMIRGIDLVFVDPVV